MNHDEFAGMALSFPGTEQALHFDRTAFKITGKRIFATLHAPGETANIRLSPADQEVFCAYHNNGIFPVPNKWGEQGWTTFELSKIPVELILEALDTAYKEVFKSRKK